MKKPYYLFHSGRLSRRDNTLKFTPVDGQGQVGQARFLPIESVEELYVFGALDTNSAMLNFLGQQHICVHFFNYYEHYSGSFMPRDYLLAGKVQVAQTQAYLEEKKRLPLARAFLDGAAGNMLRVLKYYEKRRPGVAKQIAWIQEYQKGLGEMRTTSALMGLEGNIRENYYEAFDHIITDFEMSGRSKRPPKNEINALISFGNMMCYTQCLKQIYHTQLNPTISFLHEPGYRRYSLALDLAEIFKPILVDRLIFTLLNKRVLQAKHFRQDVSSCMLKESGVKLFTRHWDERLGETIYHRTLRKKVSYRHLIKLECYKIVKHLIGDDTYQPFKIWW